jgi:hypothetical protein
MRDSSSASLGSFAKSTRRPNVAGSFSPVVEFKGGGGLDSYFWCLAELLVRRAEQVSEEVPATWIFSRCASGGKRESFQALYAGLLVVP